MSVRQPLFGNGNQAERMASRVGKDAPLFRTWIQDVRQRSRAPPNDPRRRRRQIVNKYVKVHLLVAMASRPWRRPIVCDPLKRHAAEPRNLQGRPGLVSPGNGNSEDVRPEPRKRLGFRTLQHERRNFPDSAHVDIVSLVF